MNTQQAKAILVVLNNIKTCIDQKDTYIPGVGDCHNKDENYRSPFNLSKPHGVCWHVFAHTPGGLDIGQDFLKPVFLDLGYKSEFYPVESTVLPEGDNDYWSENRSNYDLYFCDDEYSKERANLVNKLIEYFNSKLV